MSIIGLNDNAKQLLNWCRKISIMNEDEFEAEHNSLSIKEKRQLSLVSRVKQMPKICHFPWLPVDYTRNASPIQTLMPNPPINQLVNLCCVVELLQ
jgi:hypothetical protein